MFARAQCSAEGSSPARRQPLTAACAQGCCRQPTRKREIAQFVQSQEIQTSVYEIRVKIFVDLKGEEIGFMFSVHTIVWRSLFLAEKNPRCSCTEELQGRK